MAEGVQEKPAVEPVIFDVTFICSGIVAIEIGELKSSGLHCRLVSSDRCSLTWFSCSAVLKVR